ncbi:MAG: response regulator transcription factor [Tepidiformaceae bacterium]
MSPTWFDLTLRETEVLALLSDGWTNSQIAEQLVVSPETVNSHVDHILVKLRVSDRHQAGRMYREQCDELPP